MYKRARLWCAAEAVFCPFFVVLRSLWARFFFTGVVHIYKSNCGCWSQSFATTCPAGTQSPRCSHPGQGSPQGAKIPGQSLLPGRISGTLSPAPWPHVWMEPSTPAVSYPLWVFHIKPNYLSFPFRMNKDYTLMWTFSPNKRPLNNQKDFYLCNILDFSYVMAAERR